MTQGKKYNAAKTAIGATEVLSVKDALTKIKQVAFGKFDESIDLDINLGIDPSKGEQVVRGSALLPNGTGKKVSW